MNELLADEGPAPEPDAAASAFEMRWMGRAGLLPPPPTAPPPEVSNRPDAAGYDAIVSPSPRRGTVRLPAEGGPQQPAPRPPEPEGLIGPPMPDRGGARAALDAVANTFMAVQQGVVQSALEDAPVVEDPELRRLLRNPEHDSPSDPVVVEDRDISTGGRLRAAQERARMLGIDIVFRVGAMGHVEAVQRTPEMEPSGGQPGRLAYAIGSLLGLGQVDPLAGAATSAAHGVRGSANTVASGGAKK